MEDFRSIVDLGMLVIKELNIPNGVDGNDTLEAFNLLPHQKCDVLLVYGRRFYLTLQITVLHARRYDE